MGCLWAALVSLMLLVRGPAQSMLRRSWFGLVAGALLFAGPAIGLLLRPHELSATSLTMALALTPVAVGVATAALDRAAAPLSLGASGPASLPSEACCCFLLSLPG